MRVRSVWVAVAAFVLLLTFKPAIADSNANGNATTPSHWQVYAWIGQQVDSGIMTMVTTGDKVVATFKKVTIHGTLVDYGRQMNATYTGPRGQGWITLNFNNGGQGFGGTWGLKGKPADGKFVGSLVTPSPAPGASP